MAEENPSTKSTILLWSKRILGGLGLLLLATLLIAGLAPLPQDELPAPENYGAGASTVEDSITGLVREFPPVSQMAGNPSSPEKIELGRLLFFDPVLSDQNDIACATCHHPDYGFSDGLARAIGAGGEGAGPERGDGVELSRNTASLWNVAYATSLFWDGRVDSLEYQVLVPLQHTDEMGVMDTETLAAELREIPEYVDLFDQAFGGGENAVTAENVARALASFERSLLSQDSPFDRYAAGELDALTASQRRGFTIFRSAATRCFECHAAPTFATETFRIIGVPDVEGQAHDPGRAGVVADGADGAFKVPTLRNIALSGPYMHNGIFATLEEVIDFYAQGGGRAPDSQQIENIDPFVRGFTLSQQETDDLVAFLYALTDESQLPEIPDSVPSGLPVVAALDNPARDEVAAHNIGSGGQAETGEPRTLTVQPGESIQDVVDLARPGDTVMIAYGTYHERVVVDFNDITILGIANEDGEWPTLDGQGQLTEAIISSGNNFEVGNLRVVNYTDNGILVEGVTGVHMHDIYAENVGTYGLYPVQSNDVLIQKTEVVGADDAGIYAGQCVNVVVRNNVVHGNVLGIELENTVGGEIYGNYAYDNTNGILIVLLPQLTSQVSLNTVVYDNLVENNNHVNFAEAGTAASLMPSGAGIGIVAADHVEIYDNEIRGNNTAGIGIFSLLVAYDANEVDIGPTPEHIYIHDNVLEGNGSSPDGLIAEMGIPGADVLWDVSGNGVQIDLAEGSTSFPPAVPGSGWPEFIYRIYWRALNFLIGLVG